MKKFAFINAAGEPKNIVTPSDESVFEVGKLYGDLICQEVPINISDEQIINHWYWKDGSKKVRPERPHQFVKWNNYLEIWEDDLPAAKIQRWDILKQAREAAINAPLVTPYGTFDADPKSRQNITDAVLMLKSLEDLGSPTTIDFTLADDTARTLNTGEMVMVGLLLGQKIQAAHAQSRALRGALDLATTKEEVEAITWQVTT